MARFFLGVDGGGTKTKAALLSEDGNLIKTTESGGSNYNINGIEQAYTNLSQAVYSVLENISKGTVGRAEIFGCLALSGVNFPHDLQVWENRLNQDPVFLKIFPTPPLIFNDIMAALRSGTTDANAIAVISGTGSNCFGKNDQGQIVKVGGQDYILSDEGSGYWIGQEVLRSVTKSFDGRIEKTLMAEYLLQYLKIGTMTELYHSIYSQVWSKSSIAKVAAIALAAEQQHDPEAVRLLTQAGHELALMVNTAAKRLNFNNKQFTVVLSGSVLLASNTVTNTIQNQVVSPYPLAKITKPVMDSAQAAALMAMDFITNKQAIA